MSNFVLMRIAFCRGVGYGTVLSIFALNFFVEEQTQLKWTTNYKINKLSLKVAWEKASDVVTADWLNLNMKCSCQSRYATWSIFPPFVWAKSQRSRLPAFLYFWSVPLTLKYPRGQRVFFPVVCGEHWAAKQRSWWSRLCRSIFAANNRKKKPTCTQGNPKHGCKKNQKY